MTCTVTLSVCPTPEMRKYFATVHWVFDCELTDTNTESVQVVSRTMLTTHADFSAIG